MVDFISSSLFNQRKENGNALTTIHTQTHTQMGITEKCEMFY